MAGVLALAAVILIAYIGGAFDGDDGEAPTPASSLLPITIPVDATTVPASTVPGSTAPATTAAVGHVDRGALTSPRSGLPGGRPSGVDSLSGHA